MKQECPTYLKSIGKSKALAATLSDTEPEDDFGNEDNRILNAFTAIVNNICQVLNTQELMYQNSNIYCWQTMIKTGCLVLFRVAQSCVFYVKLDSS